MNLPRAPVAVIFDMDGLLLDTERLFKEALHIAAADAGHEVAPDLFNRTLGLPWPQCRALLVSHFGETFAVDDSRRHGCSISG
jgi:beta-phosphoglucomutase-like phosphatase (HAD superfamily)